MVEKQKNICDKSLVVSSTNTARIQECHIFLGHFILEKIEDQLFQRKNNLALV